MVQGRDSAFISVFHIQTQAQVQKLHKGLWLFLFFIHLVCNFSTSVSPNLRLLAWIGQMVEDTLQWMPIQFALGTFFVLFIIPRTSSRSSDLVTFHFHSCLIRGSWFSLGLWCFCSAVSLLGKWILPFPLISVHFWNVIFFPFWPWTIQRLIIEFLSDADACLAHKKISYWFGKWCILQTLQGHIFICWAFQHLRDIFSQAELLLGVIECPVTLLSTAVLAFLPKFVYCCTITFLCI